MPRKPKPGAEVETALVQRPVIDAAFVDGDKDDALARALESSTSQTTELVRLMTASYKDMVLERKIMADSMMQALQQMVELTKAKQDLLDKKDDRKLKREKEKAHQEFLQQVTGDVRALLPVIVNKFARAPVATPAEAAALKPIVESLSEKQLGGILNLLTPAQQTAFLALLQAIPDEPRGEIKKEDPPNGAH